MDLENQGYKDEIQKYQNQLSTITGQTINFIPIYKIDLNSELENIKGNTDKKDEDKNNINTDENIEVASDNEENNEEEDENNNIEGNNNDTENDKNIENQDEFNEKKINTEDNNYEFNSEKINTEDNCENDDENNIDSNTSNK